MTSPKTAGAAGIPPKAQSPAEVKTAPHFECTLLSQRGESLPTVRRQRFFFWKGGEYTLAISEKRKQELVSEYGEWLKRSQAVILTEYMGLTMTDLDNLRAKVREVGGEFHVVKNTLGKIAFQQAGMPLTEGFFEGSTAVGFAFEDAAALAKVMIDFAKTIDLLKLKGGFLKTRSMTSEQVKTLAKLPSLPVIRAQLLGALQAPASQLARTLAEPGRGIAATLKAYAEKETPAAPLNVE